MPADGSISGGEPTRACSAAEKGCRHVAPLGLVAILATRVICTMVAAPSYQLGFRRAGLTMPVGRLAPVPTAAMTAVPGSIGV
jgi:hypothetical protein